MPGKIVSKAQAAYLAIHNPSVLHELSGGAIPNYKKLPEHVQRIRGIVKRARKRSGKPA